MSAMRCSECGVEVKTDPHVCPKPQREFVARIMLIGLEPFTTQAAVLQAASPLWQHYEDHAATVAALEGRVRELEKALSEACTACGCLHHAKRDQHGSADPCPVSARIAAALSPEAKP